MRTPHNQSLQRMLVLRTAELVAAHRQVNELNIGCIKGRMETLEEKIDRVVKEDVAIVQYDPRWPQMFKEEKIHLLSCLPKSLIRRIEHFGSTAVPGLPAKPIIDILIEVSSLDKTRKTVPPILEPQGYDYFWRPTWGDDTPPFYAFFIKRDADGNRTHHIHMIEAHFEHWDRLLFRDYLLENYQIAMEYSIIKQKLSSIYRDNRIEYTEAKTDFVVRVTKIAKNFYENANQRKNSK